MDGPGVTEVVLGHATLDEALAPIAISDPPAPYVAGTSGNGGNGYQRRVVGALEVLAAGPVPPDPGEFVATQRLSSLLAELRERTSVVLIDAPPALNLGDASALSTKVDGIIVVTRIRVVRRHTLSELNRQLATMPTPVLGFVATDAEADVGYAYGYSRSYDSYEPRERQAHIEVRT